jgi:hypothetical protein
MKIKKKITKPSETRENRENWKNRRKKKTKLKKNRKCSRLLGEPTPFSASRGRVSLLQRAEDRVSMGKSYAPTTLALAPRSTPPLVVWADPVRR